MENSLLCPICGKEPETEPAKFVEEQWVCKCHRCLLCTEPRETKEEAEMDFMNGQYSQATMMISRPLTEPDPDGLIALCAAVVKMAADDYRTERRIWKMNRESNGKGRVGLHAERLEEFFRSSPLMMDLKGNGIIERLRREVDNEINPKRKYQKYVKTGSDE